MNMKGGKGMDDLRDKKKNYLEFIEEMVIK